MLYIGVDLHRKRSQDAVIDEAGKVLGHAGGDMIFVRYADDCVARTPKEDSCSRWSRRRRCCTRDVKPPPAGRLRRTYLP